jgi:hypothetical protein
MYSHTMLYLSRLLGSLRRQVESPVLIPFRVSIPFSLGGSSDRLEDVQSPLLVTQLRRFGLSYLNFIRV